MIVVRAYRNPDCVRCRRFAKVAHLFDWLGRVDFTTKTPRTGRLRMGEVVVKDLRTGDIHRGAEGIDLVWRQLPAFLPLRLLLRIPPIRRKIDKQVRGCENNACEIPGHHHHQPAK